MKKQIMNLFSVDEGEFRINPVCKLHKWTYKDGEKETPHLALEFDKIADMGRFTHAVEIVSTDFNGIVNEVSAAIEAHFSEITEWLVKCLKSGYQY